VFSMEGCRKAKSAKSGLLLSFCYSFKN
jgi:hypothetical protein